MQDLLRGVDLVSLRRLGEVAAERVVEAVVGEHVAVIQHPPSRVGETFGASPDLEEGRRYGPVGEGVEEQRRVRLVRAVVERQGDDLVSRVRAIGEVAERLGARPEHGPGAGADEGGSAERQQSRGGGPAQLEESLGAGSSETPTSPCTSSGMSSPGATT